MQCLPDALIGRQFFRPKGVGFEAKVADRMAEADRLRRGER